MSQTLEACVPTSETTLIDRLLPRRRIMAGVDRTSPGTWAAGMAMALADRFACDLGIAHVVSPPVIAEPEMAVLNDIEVQAAVDGAKHFLKALPLRHAPGRHVTRMLKQGYPVSQIVEAAADWQADLIVVGTHARRGLRRMVLGSVAAGVVQSAASAVLCCSRPAVGACGNRVLVAVDYDEQATVALDWAGLMTSPGASDVMLLHAVDLPAPAHAGYSLADTDHVMSVRRTAFDFLESLKPPCSPDARVVREIRHGNAAEAILKQAMDWKADLIVLGVSARSTLARIVLGSTADAVLRRAECPVLCVKAQ